MFLHYNVPSSETIRSCALLDSGHEFCRTYSTPKLGWNLIVVMGSFAISFVKCEPVFFYSM